MDRLAQRRRRCWVAGLTTAGLIVSAACGTEARTEDGPGHEGVHGGVEFTGGGHHTLLVTDDFPPPGEPDLVLRVGKGPLPHKENSPYQHAYRIKLNANSLKGVADVKLPCDVHESGYVSVCSGPDVTEVLKHGRTWGIRVAANDETEVGETGEWTSAAADDTATEVRLVLGDRGPARFAGSPTPARGSVIPSHGAVVVMKPPEGTTVTSIPDGCTAVDKGFRKIDQDHKWFHTFACPIEAVLLPGETVEHRFRLSGRETAPGEEVRAKIRFGYMFPDRLETEPANNRITLRLDGAGSAGTPR